MKRIIRKQNRRKEKKKIINLMMIIVDSGHGQFVKETREEEKK